MERMPPDSLPDGEVAGPIRILKAMPLLRLVMADLTATLGWHPSVAERIVFDEPGRAEGWVDDPEDIALRTAEELQQWLHDTFVDTSWPACPHHGNHPLWLGHAAAGGLAWRCEAAGQTWPLGSIPKGPEGG